MDNIEFRCRSWFVTVWAKSIRNMDLGDLLTDDGKPIDGTGQEILEQVRELWSCSGKGRTSGGTACISKNDGFHLHMGIYTPNPMKRKDVAKTLGNAHVDEQRGTKEQLIAYIKKEGKFAEKDEQVLYESVMDGIQSSQGNRSDLSKIEEYINLDMTPRQIMSISISYRKYEKLIKDAYYEKRNKETPFLRDIDVTWHVGESGSGKSYTANNLAQTIGEDKFYFVTDYDSGGFDKYNGESVLFMDEFRGQIRYSTLLTMLQGYKSQVHSRYTNCVCLWNEVHITSVLPPEKVYQNMVSENKDLDTLQQLRRRINRIIYHWKDSIGEYHKYIMPMAEYKDYETLKRVAHNDGGYIPASVEQIDLFSEDLIFN